MCSGHHRTGLWLRRGLHEIKSNPDRRGLGTQWRKHGAPFAGKANVLLTLARTSPDASLGQRPLALSGREALNRRACIRG